jgi:SSS family solute:Na+ symporter
MLIDTPVTMGMGGYEKGSFLWIMNNIYFQYFSVFITIVSAVVMIAVSYASEAPREGSIQNLTFATKTVDDKAKTRASWGWGEVAASGVVLLLITGSYLYFRG